MSYRIPDESLQPLYNHVHHADTVKILEYARIRLLENVGFSQQNMCTRGLFLVITRLDVAYKRELFAGPVTITVEAPHVEGKNMSCTQRILNSQGKDAVLATVELRMLDAALKRSVRLEPAFEEAFLSILKRDIKC